MKMYSHVPFLCKKVHHVWRGVGPTKDFPNATKAHLLLRSLSHEGIAHSLVVDFKGSLQTLTNFFLEQIHNPDASE
jgi:hypothetical protein